MRCIGSIGNKDTKMIRVLAYMKLNLYEFTQNSSVLIKLVLFRLMFFVRLVDMLLLINSNINGNSISLWSRSSDGRAPDLSE